MDGKSELNSIFQNPMEKRQDILILIVPGERTERFPEFHTSYSCSPHWLEVIAWLCCLSSPLLMQNPGTIYFSCHRDSGDLNILSLFWDQHQLFWKLSPFLACQELRHSVLALEKYCASIFLAGHDHGTSCASANFLRLLLMEDRLCPWLFQEISLRTHYFSSI